MVSSPTSFKTENITSSMANILISKVKSLVNSEDDFCETLIPDLSLFKRVDTDVNRVVIREPCVCLAIQGTKEVTLGNEIYSYNPSQFFVASANLPILSKPITASNGEPFLGLALSLDMTLVSNVLLENQDLTPNTKFVSRGISVNNMSPAMLNAFLRLVGLLDTPDDIKALSPLIKREIIYRLLKEEQGQTLRQMAIASSYSYQISKAIHWLTVNYDQSIANHELADLAGMSIASFHQHFKKLTAMTPLQFQKQLRLCEARRLMLTNKCDAATAALHVGYESPSQFSREYSKTFGAPPLKDTKNLSEKFLGDHST